MASNSGASRGENADLYPSPFDALNGNLLQHIAAG
jgi:hypothetical protein